MKTIFSVDPRLPRMISTVALEVNAILLDDEFYQTLEAHKGVFPQSNIDGPTLSGEFRRLIGRNLTAQIVPYSYPWYQPFYKRVVNAFVKAPRIRVINLNTYRIPRRDDVAWSGTIGHEFVHVVDNHSPHYFGHGDNDSSDDGGTATDFVGELVAQMYEKRRQAKVSLALAQGATAFKELGLSLGVTVEEAMQGFAAYVNEQKPIKGVHDYGTEFRTSPESSHHFVD